MTSIYNDKADDEKYIVFKSEDFFQWLGTLTTQDLRIVPVPSVIDEAHAHALKDAVVIRRQDLYASPALASYAAAIVIAIKTTDDPKTKANLQAIADYFQRQSELAAEEGWKLPDL